MRSGCAISLLLVFLTACGGVSPSSEAAPTASSADAASAETWFEVAGDVELRVEPATASIFTNRAGIVTLNVVSGREAIREHGRSHSVNLFFSRDFDPQPGTYPVKFAYRGEPNTLGGSFMGEELFSHDTEGEAEFTEFGEKIRVRFRFKTYSESEGSDDRRTVTVTGEAVCNRGDAFQP